MRRRVNLVDLRYRAIISSDSPLIAIFGKGESGGLDEAESECDWNEEEVPLLCLGRVGSSGTGKLG